MSKYVGNIYFKASIQFTFILLFWRKDGNKEAGGRAFRNPENEVGEGPGDTTQEERAALVSMQHTAGLGLRSQNWSFFFFLMTITFFCKEQNLRNLTAFLKCKDFKKHLQYCLRLALTQF